MKYGPLEIIQRNRQYLINSNLPFLSPLMFYVETLWLTGVKVIRLFMLPFNTFGKTL